MTTKKKNYKVIGTEALEELLIASYAQCTFPFSQNCPTIFKKLLKAQEEARQALGWREYDMEIKDA